MVAHQAPLSMGFSSQEYWGGLLCPPPGDLPDPGIELLSPVAPALHAAPLLMSHGEAHEFNVIYNIIFLMATGSILICPHFISNIDD